MPKKGRGTGQGDLNPAEIAAKLQTALVALYNHYAETFEIWQKSGIDTPPVSKCRLQQYVDIEARL